MDVPELENQMFYIVHNISASLVVQNDLSTFTTIALRRESAKDINERPFCREVISNESF